MRWDANNRVATAAHLATPDLVDLETVAVLRKRWRAEDLTARRIKAATDDLQVLPVDRFATDPLMVRAYDLRANVTPHVAAYIAPGIRCRVDLLSV